MSKPAVKKIEAKPKAKPKKTKEQTLDERMGFKRNKLDWLENVGAELTEKQEMFCQYYTGAPGTFGNGLQSYALAYGYDLDSLDREDEIIREEEKDAEGKIMQKREVIQYSSFERARSICSTNGNKLLTNADISARINYLRRVKFFNNKAVDSRLMELMMNDAEIPTAMRAVSEYNKLKGRIKDIVDVRGPTPLRARELKKQRLEKMAKQNAKIQS